MNILSFDIEEWYVEKKFNGGRKDKYDQFDTYLHRILDSLEKKGLKGTFFCVGRLSVDFPYVIKEIADRGHEIGCHSNEHFWLTKMTPKQLKNDTIEAIQSLENVCGQKVISYRAPAFSIGENNKWAIEVLAECGIQRDASIFPAKRDFGGFDSFPTSSPVIIESNGSQIKEFPICLTHILGKDIAYSGGGYFRFFPYNYIKKNINNSDYSICYFHIGDLVHNAGELMTRQQYETYFKEQGTLSNRIKRYIKSNLGTKGAFEKLERLLGNIQFINISEANDLVDWNKIKVVKL